MVQILQRSFEKYLDWGVQICQSTVYCLKFQHPFTKFLKFNRLQFWQGDSQILQSLISKCSTLSASGVTKNKNNPSCLEEIQWERFGLVKAPSGTSSQTSCQSHCLISLGQYQPIARWKATKAQCWSWPANLQAVPWNHESAEQQRWAEYGNGVSEYRLYSL